MSTGSGLSELRSDITAGRIPISSGTLTDSSFSGAATITSGTAAVSTLTVSGTGTTTVGGSLTVGTSSPWGNPLFLVGTSSPNFYIDNNTGNVGVGTGAPQQGLTVSKKDIALNANKDRSLGTWQTTSSTLSGSLAKSATVYANGFIYSIGGDANNLTSADYKAPINSDGTLGAWTSAGTRIWGAGYWTAGFANGYIYTFGGIDSWYWTILSRISRTKVNSDGSLGTWDIYVSEFPSARYNASSVIANGFAYVIGGSNSSYTPTNTIYYAQINSDGSFGSWQTSANSLPAVQSSAAVAVANSYLYVIGGQTGDWPPLTGNVYVAHINTDGSLGTFSTLTSLPEVAGSTPSAHVINGTIYVVGVGTSGKNVYSATINNDGTLGTWVAETPMAEGGVGSVGVTANGYIYRFNNGVSTATTYISAARTTISGSLDLLNQSSTPLGSYSGKTSSGSSIYAGDIFSNGSFDLKGSAQIWKSLFVDGVFHLNSPANNTATSPILTVTNPTSNSLFNILYSGNVGIGTTTPWAQLSINPNGITGPSFAIGSSTKTDFMVSNAGRVFMGTTTNVTDVNMAGSLAMLGKSGGGSIYSTLYLLDDISAHNWGMSYRSRADSQNPAYSLIFYSYDGSTFRTNLTLTEGGAIGIGTTSPYAKLSISGIVAASTTLAIRPVSGQTANILDIYNTNGTLGTVINSSGNVGIGTSSPWGQLSVNPTALGSGVPEFVIGSSTATHFLVNGAGNVGIGTANPTVKLDLAGGTISAGRINLGTQNYLLDGGQGVFDFSGSTFVLTSTADTFDIRKHSNSALGATLLAGTVGIGTTSPVSNLAVQGNSYVSGTSFFGGAITGTSSITMGADSYFNGVRVGRGANSLPNNTALGVSALVQVTTGDQNAAAGYQALYANTEGFNNAAFGWQALRNNTTGFQNNAFGHLAMGLNGTGYYNVAVGDSALYTNSSGYENVAVGYSALAFSTGNFNVGIGSNALYANTSGSSNVAIGQRALRLITTGSNNVALGNFAGQYETGSNSFYVDAFDRTDTAGDKAKALLYGTFHATTPA
ncbi:MAG: hypothetical protein NT077_00565, partial [Candidatus Taylorbacteria bacterium]|nr:hypothetical protein [Candidatus Taylorbacteria bacterium]